MNLSEIELLKEIALLWIKYGPDTFKSLSERLEDLKDISKTKKEQVRRKHKSQNSQNKAIKPAEIRSRSIEKFLASLEITEPEKASILGILSQQLLSRTKLPAFHHLRWFAVQNGIDVQTSNRNTAVKRIIMAFSSMSLDEVRSRIDRIPTKPENGAGTLEEWADFILNPNRRVQQPTGQS